MFVKIEDIIQKVTVIAIEDSEEEIYDNHTEYSEGFYRDYAEKTKEHNRNVEQIEQRLRDEIVLLDKEIEDGPSEDERRLVQIVQKKIEVATKVLKDFKSATAPNPAPQPVQITLREEFKNGTKIVFLEPNKTEVKDSVYKSIKWNDASAATRTLLTAVFTNEILATHSLTGRCSNAFRATTSVGKPQLNPDKVDDIVDIVTKRCLVTKKSVRGFITAKCADEDKMLRKRTLKMGQIKELTVVDDKVQDDHGDEFQDCEDNHLQDDDEDENQYEVIDEIELEIVDGNIWFMDAGTSDQVDELQSMLDETTESRNKLTVAPTEEQIANAPKYGIPTTSANQQAITNLGKMCFENYMRVVKFGSNDTTVAHALFKNVNWNNPRDATTSLIRAIFSYEDTKSKRKDMKVLSAKKAADIIELVTSNCSVTNQDVKNYIEVSEDIICKEHTTKAKQQPKRPNRLHKRSKK